MGTKQIAKNTMFLYIRMGFSMIVSLFTVRIILGALGDIDYGIYNVVAGFVGMLGFMNVSLVNGVQRYYNYELGRFGFEGLCNVYKSAMRIQMILGGVFVILIETVGLWYLNYKMVIPSDKLLSANVLIQLSLISLFLGMMQVPYMSVLIAKEKFDAYGFIGIFEVILRLAIAIAVVFIPFNKLISYGNLLLLVSVVNFLFYYIYCRRNFTEMFKIGRYDKALTINMVKFMGWNAIGSGAYIFRAQGLNLLLNSYFGVILNAANGIATQVSGAVQNFALNIVLAFKPQMVQEYAAGNKDRSFSLMMLMTRISFALIFVLSVPIILDINFILNIWLGKVPEYTASLTCLVLISMCISCWHTPITQMIQTIGTMGKFQVVTSLFILMTLVIAWLAFMAGADPTWAYYAVIIIYIINQVAAMIILREYFKYSLRNYVKATVIPCLIFAISMPILPYIYSIYSSPSVVQLVVLCAISVAVAIPLAYFTILNKDERQLITFYIKQKRL